MKPGPQDSAPTIEVPRKTLKVLEEICITEESYLKSLIAVNDLKDQTTFKVADRDLSLKEVFQEAGFPLSEIEDLFNTFEKLAQAVQKSVDQKKKILSDNQDVMEYSNEIKDLQQSLRNVENKITDALEVKDFPGLEELNEQRQNIADQLNTLIKDSPATLPTERFSKWVNMSLSENLDPEVIPQICAVNHLFNRLPLQYPEQTEKLDHMLGSKNWSLQKMCISSIQRLPRLEMFTEDLSRRLPEPLPTELKEQCANSVEFIKNTTKQLNRELEEISVEFNQNTTKQLSQELEEIEDKYTSPKNTRSSSRLKQFLKEKKASALSKLPKKSFNFKKPKFLSLSFFKKQPTEQKQKKQVIKELKKVHKKKASRKKH